MTTTIGLGQFTARADREYNLRQIESLVAQSGDAGVDILCLHELATTIYFCFENAPHHRELAEPDDGESVTRVREAAARAGVGVIFPFYERTPEGKLFNTALVLDDDGAIVGKYRKMSIPAIKRTVESEGETPADEQFYFSPGDLGFPVFDLAGIRVGILICYDRHFPEAARALGLQGADIVFVPTATYRRWIQRVWEAELTGHAIANCYYVAGVNRVGVEQGGAPGRSYFGSSVAVDPSGEVLARASDSEAGLVTVDIAAEHARDLRDLWGFFRTRRPDAYGALTEPVTDPNALSPAAAILAGR
jgi:N-carbamoylputrescine amidase